MRRRRTAALALGAFALAFGLRAGTALLTESKPLFPDYYYNDARTNDAAAKDLLAAWDAGAGATGGSRGTEGYVLWLAWLYKAAAPAPLVPKLLNSFLGALSALVLGAAAAVTFGRRAGLLTALAVAVWPSHVFFTSQNFKEAPGLLSAAAALAGWAAALAARGPGRRAAALLVGAAAMALGAAIRPQMTLFFAAAAAAGAAADGVRRGRAALPGAASLLAAAVLGTALSVAAEHRLRPRPHGPFEPGALLPRAVESPADYSLVRPDSPANVSEYRRHKFALNRIWSRAQAHRDAATELFPDARFESWSNVAVFLPKASFYELFMPLPGLYPLEGKPGRVLAAAENTAVLLGFLAAAAGFWRARRRPGAWVLAAFVACLTPAAALFEFDLGSASRHRLQPLAAAVPFAALWAAGAARRLRVRLR